MAHRFPDTGFFKLPTPACLLASASAAPPKDVKPSIPNPYMRPKHALSNPSDNHDSKRPKPQGESKLSPRPLLLLAPNARAIPPARLIGTYNQSHPNSPIVIPKFADKSGPRPHKAICFNFVTERSPGCRNPSCMFAHVDLQDKAARTIPKEFYQQFIELLRHEALAPHYSPSPALLAFPDSL